MAQLIVNNETTYTIRATKSETRTITFMDGETVLGTEVVAQGETSTKHAEFETQPLTKFEGWFKNPNFTSQIDIETYGIDEDQTLYGKCVKAYAQSLNIEQLVLDNGKGAKIDSILLARGYEFANIDQLDSLNDEKDNRNYPYLGLKLKKEGAYVGFNLRAASDLAILRFGHISEPFVIEKNGNVDTIKAQVANLTPESNQMVMYNDDNIDLHIRIRTLSGKTLVIKQIMINEETAPVTLPDVPVVEPTLYTITLSEAENGTLGFAMTGASGQFEAGETVYLSVVPNDGYVVDEVLVNGEEIYEGEDDTYSFVMPEADVNVKATFMPVKDALENTNATKQAVKVVRNGQIMIIRGDNVFNILGTELKSQVRYR